MRPFRRISLVAFATLTMSAGMGQSQQEYTLTPPADIAKQIERLKGDEGWAAAAKALAERDDAAPYLRLELARAQDRSVQQKLREALNIIEAGVQTRNRARFEVWVQARRFDLCNEVIISCSDKTEAVKLVDRLLTVVKQVGTEAAKKLDLPFDSQRGILLPRPFDRVPGGFLHLAEEEVTFGRKGDSSYPTIIRADRCELEPNAVSGWFVAVRSEVRHPPSELMMNQWDCSIALVNNAMPVKSAFSSVIVCDGDVELLGLVVRNSVVIANGSIRSAAKAQWPPIRNSVLYASGDIAQPALGGGAERSLFYAGGEIKLGEKVTKPPFGVQFLQPREFGLEPAVVDGGIQVAKLADWSPFAKHGIREGDVIVKINDAVLDSIPAFRREVRRGVVLESAVLQLRRKGETTTRIVFFNGIPIDPARIAPPPRKVGW